MRKDWRATLSRLLLVALFGLAGCQTTGDGGSSARASDARQYPKGAYPILADFGEREAADRRRSSESNLHKGVDIYAPKGTPVYAALAGRGEIVRETADDLGGPVYRIFSGYQGKQILIAYLNLDQILVHEGSVQAGQLIGTVGQLGRDPGDAFMHFEVLSGKPVDPSPFLFEYGSAECVEPGRNYAKEPSRFLYPVHCRGYPRPNVAAVADRLKEFVILEKSPKGITVQSDRPPSEIRSLATEHCARYDKGSYLVGTAREGEPYRFICDK